ncbi:MAG: hypothetical protein ACOC4E_01810 [Patescibacteria group bacterium]
MTDQDEERMMWVGHAMVDGLAQLVNLLEELETLRARAISEIFFGDQSAYDTWLRERLTAADQDEKSAPYLELQLLRSYFPVADSPANRVKILIEWHGGDVDLWPEDIPESTRAEAREYIRGRALAQRIASHGCLPGL